jgi:hypothetical protein
MSLTGGDSAVGFDCSVAKKVAGDFQVTLEWSGEAMGIAPKRQRIFFAYGKTEMLAFLRAAQNALRHHEYRDMSLFLSR